MVTKTPLGRETLAAITGELRGEGRQRPGGSAPDIALSTRPAGRETLAAISREVGPARPPLATIPYGDLVPNAPGAIAPAAPVARPSSVPPPPPRRNTPKPEALLPPDTAAPEIFEVLTFLVRSQDPSALASEEARRGFVARRLRHRLPGSDLGSVGRIDVTPWTERDTVVVRVWCRVDPAEPSSR